MNRLVLLLLVVGCLIWISRKQKNAPNVAGARTAVAAAVALHDSHAIEVDPMIPDAPDQIDEFEMPSLPPKVSTSGSSSSCEIGGRCSVSPARSTDSQPPQVGFVAPGSPPSALPSAGDRLFRTQLRSRLRSFIGRFR